MKKANHAKKAHALLLKGLKHHHQAVEMLEKGMKEEPEHLKAKVKKGKMKKH